MLRVNRDSVLGYKEKEIPFSTLSTVEDAKELAILLPGAGYTVQAPLLHFSTGVFLNKSFDVLQVNYSYIDKFYDEFTIEEVDQAIKHDVKVVIDKALANKAYENYYLIGKSLGTIAMSSELKRDVFKEAKAVWLTPLLNQEDVFEGMLNGSHSSLCFIGDNDHHYNAERYAKLANNENLATRLFPDADHSLQYADDPVNSIDILKNIVKEINEF